MDYKVKRTPAEMSSCSRCKLSSQSLSSAVNKASALTGSLLQSGMGAPSGRVPAGGKQWDQLVAAIPSRGIAVQRARRAAPRERVAELDAMMQDLHDLPELEEGEVSHSELQQFVAQHLDQIRELTQE